MAEIYYSKRSGINTDNLLDKGNDLKINEQATTNLVADNIKLRETIYKPFQATTNYIYIHNVELYIEFSGLDNGVTVNVTLINTKSSLYTEGQENKFFKDFSKGLYITGIKYGNNLYNGSYFYTGEDYGSNGIFVTELPDTYSFDILHLKSRIVEDNIIKLNVEEL